MNKTYYVSLDLETLSNHHNAVILSIGACLFSLEDGIEDTFYQNVEPKGQRELGLHISKSTIEWWKQQSPEAIKALAENKVSLKSALDKFYDWYGTDGNLPVWAKAHIFDCGIIASAYRAVYGEDANPPWNYSKTRCVRTLEEFIPMTEEQRVGTHHNALDDAISQANFIREFCNRVGIVEE